MSTRTRRSPAWALAAEVPDPEIPVVTIEDLGILRDVAEDDRGWVHVQVTPTYSGCPAMDAIADDLVERLTAAGYQHVDVEFVLSPAWTTDDISEAGLAKLAAYGVAPPSVQWNAAWKLPSGTSSNQLSAGGFTAVAVAPSDWAAATMRS